MDGELIEWLAEADQVLGSSYEAAEPIRSVDPLTPLHRALGGPVAPAGGQALPDQALPDQALLAEALLLTAAQQVGSAARTLEIVVLHARTREQFRQPIGAFQAVKHLCADMLVRAEMARTAVYAAAVTGPGARRPRRNCWRTRRRAVMRATVCRIAEGWGSPGTRRCICV